MAQIDDIVQLTISRQTAQIDITSFDIPLLLVEMTNVDSEFTDRVRTYSDLQGVASDLGINHAGYKMAQKLLGGAIKPSTFKIGKVNRQVGQVETYVEALFEVMDLDDTWYAVMAQSHLDADILALAETVQAMRKLYFTSTSTQAAYTQAQTVAYTATVKFDLANTVAGDTLSVLIAGERYQATRAASTWGVFSYVGTGTGTFTGTFSLAPATGVLTVTNNLVSYTITSAKQTINSVSAEVPAEDVSSTIPVGMDIGQRIRYAGYDRTIVMFSNTADAEYPEAAWVGTQIVEVPGSNTWEYKSLVGVTVSKLTKTQITVLEARGYNFYTPIKGINSTRRGKVAQGEWIDTMVLVDWIHARIQEQIFFRMANVKKVPLTDGGATIIENEIRSVLSQAQTNGGVDTYTVTAPRVLSIPEMVRNDREMGDFTFEARLAVAVSKVIIRGVVHA